MGIRRNLARRLLNYFIRGLILVAPLYFTLLILWTGIESLDNLLPIHIPVPGLGPVYFPGLGLLIIIGFIVFLGFIFSTVIPQSFLYYTESLLRRIPLISIIYYPIKDLILAFVGDKKKFNAPVLVTVYKDSGIKKLGFITQTDLSHLKIKDHIAVYLPHAYAFSGQLVIVPTENVVLLDASSTDIMKMIVSGGVSVRERTAAQEEESET